MKPENESANKRNLLAPLQATQRELLTSANLIPPHRKAILARLTQFIQGKVDSGEPVFLNFICTHNSRRSHIAQLWAQTAAYYFSIPHVTCFSGGTEATAFNPNAVKAMREAGFNIIKTTEGDNPVYEVHFAPGETPVTAFSKKFDDPFNQQDGFAAIMTCSDADENCPLVPGASIRIALTYDDPKRFDGTPQETAMYNERVRQIGTEILFAFSQVRPMSSADVA